MKRYKILMIIIFIITSCNNNSIKGIKHYSYDETNSYISVSRELTSHDIKSLSLLCKVWGMMKYYHPEISSDYYNWDYELFEILPLVLNTTTKDACDSLILDWITSYGNFKIEKKEYDKDKYLDINILPDFNWIDSSLINLNLYNQLIKLKEAPIKSYNSYLSLDLGTNNPSFDKEIKYLNPKYPDLGYRLLSLFRYWNIIQYYFPYRYLIDNDWTAVLDDFIPKFVNAKNEIEYQLAVMELIAQIDDAHAMIINQEELSFGELLGRYYAPLSLLNIDNNFIVNSVQDNLASKIQNGDIIRKINNRDIGAIVLELSPFIAASNRSSKVRNICSSLLRSKDSCMIIDCERNGEIYKEIIKCLPIEEAPESNIKPSFSILDTNIGYINIGSLMCDSIHYIMDILKQCKGLIIDLREYPNDFPIYQLGFYLMPRETIFAKTSYGSIEYPGAFCFSSPLTIGSENPDYYKGLILILINECTQSLGEFHAMALKVAPNAVLIGSQTAGADGNISYISLPGGITTIFTGIGIYYPNGDETQRIGIIPDIEITPTLNGVKEGRDELLEEAIKYISKNNFSDSKS